MNPLIIFQSFSRASRVKKVNHLLPLVIVTIVIIFLIVGTGFSEESASPTIPKNSKDNRFVNNGDHTITDTKTGIMWLQMDSFQQTGHWMNWKESFDYIKNLNSKGFASYFDWQMPTLADLRTLYEPDKLNSSQVGREMKIHFDPIFAKEGAGAHWSSEENGKFNAFGFIFNNGVRFSAPKTARGRKAVRAMRIANP